MKRLMKGQIMLTSFVSILLHNLTKHVTVANSDLDKCLFLTSRQSRKMWDCPMDMHSSVDSL